MKKRFVVGFVTIFALLGAAQGVVYRSGVHQGKYGCTTSAYPNWSQDLRALPANMQDRALGPVMADTTGSALAVSGTSWNWTGDNITYGYDGFIWMESGKTYQIWECNDDGAAIRLNGKFVVSNSMASASGYGEGVRLSTMSVTETGWHPVQFWTYDWTGGAGPVSAKSGSSTMGLAWNTNGSTTVNSTTTSDGTWTRFRDSGNMTFLKTATSESFMTLNSVSAVGDDLVASMTFNAPTNATLVLLHGDESGGDLDVQSWDSQIDVDSIAPGSLTTNIVVAGLDLESEPYACFYLRSAPTVTGAQHVFEEWLVPFQISGTPEATFAVDAVDYTTASFSATAVSMGLGGTSVDLSVEIASDSGFASIIDTIAATNGILSVPCSVSGIANTTALVTNTTYYARAKLVNQNSAVGYSDVVSFTTLNPGIPVVSGASAGAGFDYGRLAGSISAYGAGSTNALLYVDVSETADFAAYTAFGGSNVVGQLPAGRGLVATGLDNGTAYYARIRAVNSWGLAGVSSTIPFETRLEPWAASPIGAAAVSGGTQLSMSIIELVEGAAVDATLAIGTTEENALQVASWNGMATAPSAMTYIDGASTGTYVAQYIVTSTFGGEFYAETNTLTFTVGLNVYVAPTLADLVALRLKAGESVALPPLVAEQDFYRVLNARVATLGGGGVSLTAVGPGGTGVELWTYDPALGTTVLSGTGGLIVVPEPVGAGRVYLFKENAAAWNWNDAANWECVSDPGHAGYPDAIDDVAMILYYSQSSKTMTVGSTADPSVTIGEIYVGQLKSESRSLRLQGANSEVRALDFQRSNGESARLLLTGGAWNSLEFRLYLGGTGDSTRLSVNAVSDLDYDAGYCFVDSTRQRNTLSWDRVGVNIPAGRKFRIINGHPTGSVNQGSFCYIGSNTRFTGSGVFWHDAMLNVHLDFTEFSGFSGILRDTGYGHAYYDRSANFQFKTPHVANAKLEVGGFVTRDFTSTTSAGYCAWGIGHGYGDSGPVPNRVPAKGVSLAGGMLEFRPERNTSWGPGSVLTNKTDVLEIKKGLSYVHLWTDDTNVAFPTNTFTAGSLANTDKGTLLISEPRTRNNSTTTKAFFTLNGFVEQSFGGTGDLASEKYPIVPWLVAMHGNQWTIRFAAVNGQNQMHRPVYVNVAPDAATDPLRNVYADGQSIALSADRTVNSLWLYNRSHGKRLGAGRTLTIASGGLILHGDGSKIGEQNGDLENGALVFGGTAYVYAMSISATDPAQIWAPVTAPQGFVCGYFGTLVLAGDQTGIDDEIVVNNGILHLGSLDGTVKAQIDADLRIVGQNAKVKVNVPGTLNQVNVRFDDAYQFSGKLELPAGKTEICRMLFIGDGEDSMPRGTYGSSASTAEFVDDAHFTGTGVLAVTRDNFATPSVITIR